MSTERNAQYTKVYLLSSHRPWRQADKNLILEYEIQEIALKLSRVRRVATIGDYQRIVEKLKFAKRTAIEVVDDFLLGLETN